MKGKGVDLFSTLFPLFDSENMEPIRHEPICAKRKLINIFICGKCFIEFFIGPCRIRGRHILIVLPIKNMAIGCVFYSAAMNRVYGAILQASTRL